MLTGKCPNCGHEVEIPSSVRMYECLCGKVYEIKVLEEEVSKP